MSRITIIGFIAILLLIAGGTVWYLISSSGGLPTAPSETASTTGTVFSGEAIYTNGPQGFLIRYPENALVSDSFASYYHLAPTWRANPLEHGTGTPVVSFTTYSTKSESSYPRYFDALVRVGVSSDAKEVAQCLKAQADQGEVALPDKTIGNRVWKAFSFENAGMQQYVRGISYRTMHEEKCVALEQIAVGSNYREDAPSKADITDVELASRYEELGTIIDTFMFVR